MYKAILFDLDDTLLGNNMETFIPRYFAMLKRYADGMGLEIDLMQELLVCTQATIQNVDPTLTNREVFWGLFAQRTGLDTAELEVSFDRFYREQFPKMHDVTEFRPKAPELIQACFERGYKVVIATNPLFPQRAIEERLVWAGIPVTEFDYALVTTYDNMHATKPNQAYYVEILENIGVAPQDAIMIGDDWNNDIAPAATLGLDTYWISAESTLPDAIDVRGAGSLSDFARLLDLT
jgi:HAD superfamily hydrolase (TIGR01549 family)